VTFAELNTSSPTKSGIVVYAYTICILSRDVGCIKYIYRNRRIQALPYEYNGSILDLIDLFYVPAGTTHLSIAFIASKTSPNAIHP
jgi:hypothetical protein